MAWLGRWHPLVLHFPIVLLLVLIFISFVNRKLSYLLFLVATITTLLTAISGFFLGLESESKGLLLNTHQWLGIGLAVLTTIWFWLYRIDFKNKIISGGIKLGIAVLIGFTGHYGGMVTHGEDFLAFPSPENEKIPENPVIYNDVVHRIIDRNCVSCHNPNKQKGGLLMTNFAALLKGGDGGKVLIPNDPENSELIKRLHLPIDDKEHMPPEGKKHLTQLEIQILEQWILLGASDTLQLSDLEDNSSLSSLIQEMTKPDDLEKWAGLPKIQDNIFQGLSTDYLTIKRIANGANALSINAYMPPEYDAQYILDLQPVAKHIVELDLSGLPLGDQEFALIATCENLEHLELDNTPLDDAYFALLKSLSKIEVLKVYSTQITDKSVAVLKEFKQLKSLYIYDTDIPETVLTTLASEMEGVQIDVGVNPELYEKSVTEKDTIE